MSVVKNVCRRFLQGVCGYGNRCRFDHPTGQSTATPTSATCTSATPTATSSSSLTRKRKKASLEAVPIVSVNLLRSTCISARGWHKRRRKSIVETDSIREKQLLSLTSSIVNKGVNVLNNVNLTLSELAVLSCGFSFIPSPQHKRKWSDDLMRDFTRFERNVRIKHFFKDCTITQKHTAETLLHMYVSKLRVQEDQLTGFTPPKASPAVELYLNQVKRNLSALSTTTVKSHMSRLRNHHNNWSNFYSTVAKLKTREDIVIYPADKNMGPSVLAKEFYIKEGESIRHFGDTSAYKPLEPTQVEISERYKLLHIILMNQKWLPKKEAVKLYDDFTFNANKVNPCNAYLIPKVHKKDLAMRLICASCSWLTYLPSKYIAYTLQPILKSLPSYIEDSASLVKLLENTQISVYDQLVTADVISLYPSIIIVDGLSSLKMTLLQKGLDKNHVKFILDLTSWVLHNNVISFNGKLYLQIKGTAMGTPLAVAYACIHMHVIEREAFRSFTARGYSLSRLKLYVRFIDDIYFIATDYDHAKLLLDIINGRRPSIKLEFHIKNTSVDFLDITIFKAGKPARLQVKLFQKPGSKYLFLPPMSLHPPHIFNGWIQGYIRRMRLNCSLEQDFRTALKDFKTHLENRGYTKNHLEVPFSLIPNRQDLLTPKIKSVYKGTLFVTTYNTEVATNKAKLIHAVTTPRGLELHPDIEFILEGRNRPMLALRREQNLREMLVRANLHTTTAVQVGPSPPQRLETDTS